MASKILIPIAYTLVVLFASYDTEAAIGINWGRQSAQRLLPSQVVDLLLQNRVGHARIYTSQPDILAAFAGSGINLTVTINPGSITSSDDARAWVKKNMDYFVTSNIRSVYLGGYVFSRNPDKAKVATAMQTLRWVQGALNEQQLGHQVKMGLLNYELGLKLNRTKPSEAEFIGELKEEMIEYLQFLQENDAPFPIDIFPLMEAVDINRFDLSFAFPDNKSNIIIKDINGVVYNNIFDWQFDCFVWALKKLNASNQRIVVSQVGWPTDGFPGANAANAEYFFKHLLPLVVSNKGTPMRPGQPIDIYVHALADETQMRITPFTPHWGIYRSNGEPKYKIDLSGQGRDIYPSTVKGIMRMPHRWCVFNGDDGTVLEKVKYLFDKTCNKTDCSSLAPGGSCSKLNIAQNVSYAFNIYFQYHFQDESACDFEGFGRLSVVDPSTEECVFPVEVVKGNQVNFFPPTGNGFCPNPSLALLFLFWVLVFGENEMLFM